jgi:hypothetical protein
MLVEQGRAWLREHGADDSILDGLADYDEMEDARAYAAAIEEKYA